MDIIVITRDRPELTVQTLRSMRENAADWSRHRLVVVFDGTNEEASKMVGGAQPGLQAAIGPLRNFTAMCTGKQLGVGGAKNFGARTSTTRYPPGGKLEDTIPKGLLMFEDTIPKGLLMFSDNDMYYLPGWDKRFEQAFYRTPPICVQIGGWRHPFHQLGETVNRYDRSIKQVDAVTGNCFVIRWSDWLKYGPFDSNAIGPGQSEDFAFSRRIKAGGGLVATLDPPVAIHCGLVNSSGEPAVGWREMAEMARTQLLGMSESERVKVKLEVPIEQPAGEVPVSAIAPGAGLLLPDDPGYTYRYIGRANERVAFTGLTACSICGPNTVCTDPTHPRARIVKSQYAPGSHITVEEGAQRLNDAAVEMGLIHPVTETETPIDVIRPGKHPIGSTREITLDEARKMYPHGDDDGLPTDNPWGSSNYPTYGSEKARLAAKGLDIGDVRIGINVGSGQRRFHSTDLLRWINCDSQSVPPDRVPDIVCNVGVEKLPFSDGVAKYVVLHQVAEHFGCGESAPMLRECWRVLAPGGSLIITVPDMRALAGRWLGGELDTQLYMTNVYGAYMGDEADRHKWGFTGESLRRYLTDLLVGDMDRCDIHVGASTHAGVSDCRLCGDFIKPLDWREIPGAAIARDFWILGIEVVKPS